MKNGKKNGKWEVDNLDRKMKRELPNALVYDLIKRPIINRFRWFVGDDVFNFLRSTTTKKRLEPLRYEPKTTINLLLEFYRCQRFGSGDRNTSMRRWYHRYGVRVRGCGIWPVVLEMCTWLSIHSFGLIFRWSDVNSSSYISCH